MIRFLLRFLGVLCLAGAFFFVIHDGTKSIADQRWYITRVSDLWALASDGNLSQIQSKVETLAPSLWDPVVLPVLRAPGWLVLVILGIFLIIIGRKKKPLIGYTR